jgi:hypothetical protein
MPSRGAGSLTGSPPRGSAAGAVWSTNQGRSISVRQVAARVVIEVKATSRSDTQTRSSLFWGEGGETFSVTARGTQSAVSVLFQTAGEAQIFTPPVMPSTLLNSFTFAGSSTLMCSALPPPR